MEKCLEKKTTSSNQKREGGVSAEGRTPKDITVSVLNYTYCIGASISDNAQTLRPSLFYCIIALCRVTFSTHPEIIPLGQFFRRWIKAINQA